MNDIKVIHATNGGIILVSEGDFDAVRNHRWQLINGYARRSLTGGKCVYMHREIMGAVKKQEVDHKSHYPWVNARWNLRSGTSSQNKWNMRKTRGISKFKGVSWDKRKGKWFAQIKKNYKHIFLGYYETEREAAISYNGAAIVHFGEFALLNEL